MMNGHISPFELNQKRFKDYIKEWKSYKFGCLDINCNSFDS